MFFHKCPVEGFSGLKTILIVAAARLLLVSLGYCSLEAYLAGQSSLTAGLSMSAAVTAIWIDRKVIARHDRAAAVGSVLGIGLANFIMASLRG